MAPEFHDWISKHNHHHHHHHYHHHHHHHQPSRVRSWYSCFTKHVTLVQLPHSNLSFLNPISILSSNLHLHLFILKILNPSFVWITHFVYMCTCPTYLIILDLTILGILSDTDQHLWISHSSLILLQTITLLFRKALSRLTRTLLKI